jgi:hypothetical protein
MPGNSSLIFTVFKLLTSFINQSSNQTFTQSLNNRIAQPHSPSRHAINCPLTSSTNQSFAHKFKPDGRGYSLHQFEVSYCLPVLVTSICIMRLYPKYSRLVPPSMQQMW